MIFCLMKLKYPVLKKEAFIHRDIKMAFHFN